ncbi:MAG: ASKHA domain-containing protein [Dehalococcoidales bacterium]|nr:ASKHA domain-containing protein [Dehalococcoidales bacterium]
MKKLHSVVFQPSGVRGQVAEGVTILDAARQLGAGLESICGGKGVCGKCKVRVEEGYFPKYHLTSSVSSVSVSGEVDIRLLSHTEFRQNYRLACQTKVHGDIVVFIPEESRKGEQVVRKEATARRINVNPAVRKYYVELTPATLHDPLGDFERLAEKLTVQYGLDGLTIDYRVLLKLADTLRRGGWKVTVSVWHGREIIDVEAGRVERGYGFAVDIGTTTVAGYLCDLNTGDVLATEAIMNPQVAYGEDVISRITHATRKKNGLRQLNRAIVEGLNQIAAAAAARAGINLDQIVDMAVVGNTCMHHLFLNINPRHLGNTPFPPVIHHSVDVKARDLGLRVGRGAYVHVLPNEAGFVGADNVGVLIAEEPHKQDKMLLIIDIGTNGELLLGNRRRLLSTSCATGPAFEGAEIRHGMRAAAGAIEKLRIDPVTKEVRFKVIGREKWNTEDASIGAKGICGSGIFDAAAQMFLAGIIDRSGRFNTGVESPRLRLNGGEPEFVIAWAHETSIGRDIVICQKDIRAIQLAKAAMYSGAKLMMKRLGIERVDGIVLAGAFGTYIDKESAAVIGLFPDCDLKDVRAVGNAAGDGARMALLDVEKRKEADLMARKVEYVELTVEPDFHREFTQALAFPHAADGFPHLAHLLPHGG